MFESKERDWSRVTPRSLIWVVRGTVVPEMLTELSIDSVFSLCLVPSKRASDLDGLRASHISHYITASHSIFPHYRGLQDDSWGNSRTSGPRFDYCYFLLAGTSVKNLACLQLVQNTLARVDFQKSGFSCITPVLADQHWLPVHRRISFKIATIPFEMLPFQQSSYLATLISSYHFEFFLVNVSQ